MKLICTPELEALLKKFGPCGSEPIPPNYAMKNLGGLSPLQIRFDEVDIVADPYMPKDVPTGKYIDQQGNVMAKDEIRVSDRFVEYGPEDLELLLFLGLLKPERKTMAYFFNSYNYSFMPKYMGLTKSSV